MYMLDNTNRNTTDNVLKYMIIIIIIFTMYKNGNLHLSFPPCSMPQITNEGIKDG